MEKHENIKAALTLEGKKARITELETSCVYCQRQGVDSLTCSRCEIAREAEALHEAVWDEEHGC